MTAPKRVCNPDTPTTLSSGRNDQQLTGTAVLNSMQPSDNPTMMMNGAQQRSASDKEGRYTLDHWCPCAGPCGTSQMEGLGGLSNKLPDSVTVSTPHTSSNSKAHLNTQNLSLVQVHTATTPACSSLRVASARHRALTHLQDGSGLRNTLLRHGSRHHLFSATASAS